jgi:geranylgeranyl pyrophosphate synthase
MTFALKTYLEEKQSTSLLDRLEREFACGLSSALPGSSLDRLPGALRRALVEPARHVLDGPKKELRAQLIRLSYRVAGGRDAPPDVLAHLIEVLHAGSLVIDDVEDGSAQRRGKPALHRVVGQALAINTGNWLYFWAMELVRELGLDGARELELHRQLSRTLSIAHWGQALDLDSRVSELDQKEVADVARATSELKTGALMAFAARSGAIVAGAPQSRSEALARFGLRLGLALQRFDDLGGLLNPRMRDKGLEDLRHQRVTWPWAFLASRLDPSTYSALTHQLASREPHTLEQLRATMTTHLIELEAATEPKQELRRTLHQLSRDVNVASDVMAQLAEHLEKLEASYV